MALPINNVQVVLALLVLWNKGRTLTLPAPINYRPFQEWEKDYSSVKFLWQDLQTRINNHDPEAQKMMLQFWPKE